MKAEVRSQPAAPIIVRTYGHRFEVDGKGRRGPTPLALLLSSLGGCHVSVLTHILRIMRMPWKELELRLEGEVTREDPKTFSSIHLAYEVRGEFDEKKARRALELAGRYCAVSVLLERAGVTLTHELIVSRASDDE
ncbi:MAG: OsmC family protein [Thermoplasmata archaeon]